MLEHPQEPEPCRCNPLATVKEQVVVQDQVQPLTPIEAIGEGITTTTTTIVKVAILPRVQVLP